MISFFLTYLSSLRSLDDLNLCIWCSVYVCFECAIVLVCVCLSTRKESRPNMVTILIGHLYLSGMWLGANLIRDAEKTYG